MRDKYLSRKDSEPGLVLVHGVSQMLPLAKKYFYISLNEAITMNEIKWATLVSVP